MSVPRAPQQDGAVVAVPPLGEVGPLLEANRRRLAAIPSRGEARREVVAAARDYLATNGEPLPAQVSADSLLLAGHQPELFHPGVWVKNFALNGLARLHGVTPLNLVVDNDTVKSTALRMPAAPEGAESWTHLTSVAFDHPAAGRPWEEQRIQDRALFAEFAGHVTQTMHRWGIKPILTDFWPVVLDQAKRTSLLGQCFAAARRDLERRWGCPNLEVPLSAVCRSPSFARFAAHLLDDLPRFQAVYNDAVHAYRRANHIKSRNHPVPDLATDGDWLEAPLWGWRADQVRRGRLFVRLTADQVELRCGVEKWPTLPRHVDRLAEVWPALETQGFKVRTRALTTTLYARLFLADLFIHGIGGGKYDELTDVILHRFYGVEPPGFLVLSATRLLPLPSFAVTPDDCRRLARDLRDLHWNPQRHLTKSDELSERKWALIRTEPADAKARRERFEALRGMTEALRKATAAAEERLREQRAECERRLQANAVLRRRDYSFCLYPEDMLRPFCTQFLEAEPPGGMVTHL